MKQFAVLLVPVFAAVLNVHSVSTVSAGCWQGDSECSWFQGEEELKRATCFIEECEEAGEKRIFKVRFAVDEKK